IGRATAEVLLDRGVAHLYAAVRRPDTGQPLVDADGEDRVPVVELDVTDEDTVTAAAETADNVTVLINNAGVLTPTEALADDAPDQLEYELDVNVRGVMSMCRAFVPVIRRNGGGAVANINSVVSLATMNVIGTYSATKAASFAYTQALRQTLADDPIHVMSVHPGPIDTDMTDGMEMDKTDPTTVGEAIADGLADETYLLFPDPWAEDFWEGFRQDPAAAFRGDF
ncbi:MAG: SDR family NAD(P)-dependent oxidoreductase, partial [Phycisphaeraceae bacterium]|nr:SDR family NAD(P)-dependent oxidoreductase [Phycisphaeraceae bacterium]